MNWCAKNKYSPKRMNNFRKMNNGLWNKNVKVNQRQHPIQQESSNKQENESRQNSNQFQFQHFRSPLPDFSSDSREYLRQAIARQKNNNFGSFNTPGSIKSMNSIERSDSINNENVNMQNNNFNPFRTPVARDSSESWDSMRDETLRMQNNQFQPTQNVQENQPNEEKHLLEHYSTIDPNVFYPFQRKNIFIYLILLANPAELKVLLETEKKITKNINVNYLLSTLGDYIE